MNIEFRRLRDSFKMRIKLQSKVILIGFAPRIYATDENGDVVFYSWDLLPRVASDERIVIMIKVLGFFFTIYRRLK